MYAYKKTKIIQKGRGDLLIIYPEVKVNNVIDQKPFSMDAPVWKKNDEDSDMIEVFNEINELVISSQTINFIDEMKELVDSYPENLFSNGFSKFF